MMHVKKTKPRVLKRIQILFAIDANASPSRTYEQIVKLLGVSKATLVATAKDFHEKGLDYSLSYKYAPSSVPKRKMMKEIEAHAIQMAYSYPPDGFGRWMLELLTEKVNSLKLGEPLPLRPGDCT